jgi:hypothetical protein
MDPTARATQDCEAAWPARCMWTTHTNNQRIDVHETLQRKQSKQLHQYRRKRKQRDTWYEDLKWIAHYWRILCAKKYMMLIETRRRCDFYDLNDDDTLCGFHIWYRWRTLARPWDVYKEKSSCIYFCQGMYTLSSNVNCWIVDCCRLCK